MREGVRNYRRMIAFVKPHLSRLYLAFFSMIMNSLFSGLPIIGLIIPFVDTILAGKPIVVPHADRMPPFFSDALYRVNSLPRAELLNFLILWTIALSFVRLFFEYLQ